MVEPLQLLLRPRDLEDRATRYTPVKNTQTWKLLAYPAHYTVVPCVEVGCVYVLTCRTCV